MFGRSCVEDAGLFCEKKKLRLILVARRGNNRFLPPPRVELVSAGWLSRTELDMPDGEGSIPVYCGTGEWSSPCGFHDTS